LKQIAYADKVVYERCFEEPIKFQFVVFNDVLQRNSVLHGVAKKHSIYVLRNKHMHQLLTH